MYDVVISGAGPAGSKCAEVLAKNGFKVALIEKNTNWRKPCGGGVNAEIFNYFPSLKKLNLQKINNVSMFSADYTKLDLNFGNNSENYYVVMDRLILDNFLRKVAVDAGAELFDKNVSFDFITKNKEKIGIKTRTPTGIKDYYGKILVIADGMSSKLATKSGLRGKWKSEDLGLAKCSILEGNNRLKEDSLYVYLRKYKGYGWIFPMGGNRFNIGCGAFGAMNSLGKEYLNYDLHKIYHEFITDPNIKKYIPENKYKKIWSASYPLPNSGVMKKPTYSENLMLIGDAAGFVSPISGEGITPSVVSGNVAAETAIEAFENDNISSLILKKFKINPLIKTIIQNFKLKKRLSEVFYNGQNLKKIFELAEKVVDFKNQIIKMLLFNITPQKNFFSLLSNF